MRIGGGIPGTSHSVLVPGASAPTRWIWDATGSAVVEDAVGQHLLALAGRAPFQVIDAEAQPDAPMMAATAQDAGTPEISDDDLRPLTHYTFDTATESSPGPSSPKPKPKRKRG